MQKLTITIALAVIALALGTMATTTTMQIQPAYSQATHCTTSIVRPGEEARTTCVTPGQIPTGTACVGDDCRPLDLTHQDAGILIGRGHQGCARGFSDCTVGNPND
jgi:hypothetical protein